MPDSVNLRLAAILTAMLASSPGHGQTADDRKSIGIPKSARAPVIDGVLDPDEWSDAVLIDDFHQFEPVDQGTPSERTVVRLKFDADNLYIGAMMYDSDPSRINARELIQGQTLRFDDAVEVVLDPFDNRRSGYNFQVNPNGVRRESIYENVSEQNRDWEAIWLVASNITEEGWVAEYAIPFKSLSFDPTNDAWGFSFARTIARKKEEIAWSSVNRRVNPSTTGLMTGVVGADQGIGLDVVPAITASTVNDDTINSSDSDFSPSLDIFYRFTPSLAGTLTFNTDFAATEVDDQQVNLTRFSLFLAEKRDFFLQGADIFAFGGLRRENGMPYFSRRIGLGGNGEPLDITAGAKLTGRIGRLNVGFLNVLQDDYLGSDSNALVTRLSYDVLEESSIGAILTNGDPLSDADNTVIGADFRYRSKNVIPDSDFTINGWVQSSDTGGVSGDDMAWGLRVDVPREEGLSGGLGFKRIEENFNPALGFVNRPDIDQTNGELFYALRFDGSLIRKYTFGTWFEDVTDNSGNLESRLINLIPLQIETHSGDQAEIEMTRHREVIDVPFEIVDGVVIQPGDYTFDRYEVELESAGERTFSASVEMTFGDFYDGDLFLAEIGVGWRPNRHFSLGVEFEYNDGSLPAGDFITRLIQVRANVAFNSRWSWLNYIQYDNQSEEAGLNSRLRWNPRAGQDFFLVFNKGYERDPSGSFRSTVSELTAKLGYTFRF